MVVRNNRRNRRQSGSRMNEKQMYREPQPQPQPQPQASRPPADPGNVSFLSLNSTRGSLIQDQDPDLPQRVVSAMPSIPNPFSTSPTPSQASADTSSSHVHDRSHTLSPMALSTVNLISHTPQYAHTPTASVAESSISNYPETSVLSEYQDNSPVNVSQAVSPMEHDVTRASSVVDYREMPTVDNAEYPDSQGRPASFKQELNQARVDTDSIPPPLSKADQKAARVRELNAMLNLISALEASNASQAAVPTSLRSLLQVDTEASTGMSRLSMGEGIVTPVGGDGDNSASEIPLGFDSFPLPPADVFRAALGLGGHREG
ncbi:hypothetical protein JB92DRAFT_1783959 [Gautieria morchelliformis]|nr:hypothetical protein JB92DRAFT_1783959 [Gautieria morchelliformis]